MSEVKVNKISPRTNCGTVQLGDSGDTITIPAGATITNNGTQTGFGRTGTVDWQTTVKTSSFTAANGEGYFVNTTSAAITVTLPASPSVGDIVAVADYAGTAETNNITIARNGSNFEGGTENGGIATNRQTATFIYADATQGWVVVNSNDASFILPTYITATGGTVTTDGNFKIHTFTGPGTFCVSAIGNPLGSTTVDYLVVAGGGGGGASHGGGGGAGGYRESSGAASGCYTVSPLGACVSALPVSVSPYPITVGGGGAAAPGPTPGANSVFSTITSAGGGSGGSNEPPSPVNFPGDSGGSGGGSKNCGTAGSGNTPPVSPPQGNDGGPGDSRPGAGGGGGATAAGGAAACFPNTTGAPGGAGATSHITGSAVGRAGGGAGQCGGTPFTSPTGAQPFGGGSATPNDPNNAGDANTGGGGGGNTYTTTGPGGSGVVIIRYRFQ